MRQDRLWMYNGTSRQSRYNDSFLTGLQEFITFATNQPSFMDGDKIRCPCLKCGNGRFQSTHTCEAHLLKHGFKENYYTWRVHGEPFETTTVFGYPFQRPSRRARLYEPTTFASNPFQSMIVDMNSSFYTEAGGSSYTEGGGGGMPQLHTLADKFWKALDAAQQPIWPGNTTETKLSSTLKLLNIKSDNNWSEKSVNENLDFIRSILPPENVLPENFYTIKKLVEDLGLPVVRIDVCKSGCMLFWNGDSETDVCKFCNVSRYKERNGIKKPYKQLFYLPLTPRLQRLYASKVTAEQMTWHANHVSNEDLMCHPSDGFEWKNFSRMYPDFGEETRNVRLGLCSDGFAPFGQFGKPYSCWPVMLTPYNLPPGMCMKTPYMFISLIIPGPKSPKKNIDIYLQPLIQELKHLWFEGVCTYDVSRGDTFNMRAMVIWTVSDFPAYGMLSGWSTHGIDSCPVCMKNSKSFRLKYGKKPCYFDSQRQFLPTDHPYRQDLVHFIKNRTEESPPPCRLSGNQLWSEICHMEYASDIPTSVPPGFGDWHKWTKKSIFWELPYWGTLTLRHNLDFMHVEKNVFENIIHTLMNVKGKTKDNINSRMDMYLLCERPELHIDPGSTSRSMRKASYTLSKDDNRILCDWIRNLKFPDGYVSNLSRCVDTKDCKLMGLKSHDCHVFLQRLLPIAFKNLLPTFVWGPLTDFSNFMQDVSTTNITVTKMQALEFQIPVILCNLAKIFPPSFFDSMEHLTIHLPFEAKIGGPVQYRWMYPFERYLHNIKHKIKNKARIEASICNAYILQEISTFASYYFEDNITCKRRMPQRNTEGQPNPDEPPISIFNYLGRCGGAKSKRFLSSKETLVAHTYILLNCPEVEPYFITFCTENTDLSPIEINNRFASWFRLKILDEVTHSAANKGLLYYLSFGPMTPSSAISVYFINGYVWRPNDYGMDKPTMNSGICVSAKDADYYGLLEEILELQYPGSPLHVVLFKCKWFDPERGTRVHQTYRIVEVNMTQIYKKYDPFVLAQQGIQVYYSNYPMKRGGRVSNWVHVTKTKARGEVEENWKMDEEVVYQHEVPISHINITIPITIPLYDINSLRDPTGIIDDGNEGVTDITENEDSMDEVVGSGDDSENRGENSDGSEEDVIF